MRPAALIRPLLVRAGPALAQPACTAPACTAPAGPLQAANCADAELRAADRRVRALTRAELLDEHGFRREALDEAIRQDRAMRALLNRAPQGTPRGLLARPAEIERRCLGEALFGCRVVATGMAIPGDGRARILWQQQQGHTEANGVSGGMALPARRARPALAR